jgi:hypothetical protein
MDDTPTSRHPNLPTRQPPNKHHNLTELTKQTKTGKAPLLNLDDKAYKLVQQLEAATQGGAPSLVAADRVTVQVRQTERDE